MCRTFISLQIWTLSTPYDMTHLDTALRFIANVRKKIGWQKGDGNGLQKGVDNTRQKPGMLQGSVPCLYIQPFCCSNPLGNACDLTLEGPSHSPTITCIPAFNTSWFAGRVGSFRVGPVLNTWVTGTALLAVPRNEIELVYSQGKYICTCQALQLPEICAEVILSRCLCITSWCVQNWTYALINSSSLLPYC